MNKPWLGTRFRDRAPTQNTCSIIRKGKSDLPLLETREES